MNPDTSREAAGFSVPEEEQLEQEEQLEEQNDAEEESEGPLPSLPDDPIKKAEKLSKMIAKFSKDPPSASKLMEWKAKCGGEIFVLYLFDKAFIYRAMRRQEYNMLMEDEQFSNLKPSDREAHIVDRCLLWPHFSAQEKASSPAGLYTTLFNEIQANSLFLDPQTCSALTIKL